VLSQNTEKSIEKSTKDIGYMEVYNNHGTEKEHSIEARELILFQ
jgi:hypothetical protein